jgi:hypothetical protein
MWPVEATDHPFCLGNGLLQQFVVLDGDQQSTPPHLFGLEETVKSAQAYPAEPRMHSVSTYAL